MNFALQFDTLYIWHNEYIIAIIITIEPNDT